MTPIPFVLPAGRILPPADRIRHRARLRAAPRLADGCVLSLTARIRSLLG